MTGDDWPQATKLFREAIDNDPQNRNYKEDYAHAVIDRARAFVQQGKFEQAISDLKDAIPRFPQDGRFPQEAVKAHLAWAQKVQSQEGGGDLYRARDIVRRALKILPNDANAKAALERIEQQIKKKEDAGKKGGGKS
jgi:tetratricopeptide (TPR) repeat protein